jgi:hypothetical protein
MVSIHGKTRATTPYWENVMKEAFNPILTTLLLVLSCSVSAMNVPDNYSGSWYDPDHSGHGLNIESVDDEKLVIYWYTFHPDGTPMWLAIEADLEGEVASGDAFHHDGVLFGTFDPAALNRERWGSVSIRFLNCYTARLSYDSDASHDGMPYGSGDIDLVRLTLVSGQHIDCPTALEPGFYGNYSATLDSGADGDATGFSYVTIHRDGRLAYRAGTGGLGEIGLGRITMTGENTFYFAARYTYTEQSEVSGWSRRIDGFRQGAGTLEDGRLVLDLGERGVLKGSFKPGFDAPVSLEEMAGTYYTPFIMDTRVYHSVSDNGDVNFGWHWGCPLSGTLSIPDQGLNQLLLEGTASCGEAEPALALGEYDRDNGILYFIEKSGENIYEYRLRRE